MARSWCGHPIRHCRPVAEDIYSPRFARCERCGELVVMYSDQERPQMKTVKKWQPRC